MTQQPKEKSGVSIYMHPKTGEIQLILRRAGGSYANVRVDAATARDLHRQLGELLGAKEHCNNTACIFWSKP